MDAYNIDTDGLIVKRASSQMKLDNLFAAVKKLNHENIVMQLFDPNWVVNNTHVVGAYVNALLAFDNETNKTNSIAMEMLLFAAFTDQIGKALEIAGAKSASDFILFTNSKEALHKIMSSVTVQSDFKQGTKGVRKMAQSIGIKDGDDIDAWVLQKMALSRLSSD